MTLSRLEGVDSDGTGLTFADFGPGQDQNGRSQFASTV